MSEIVKGEWEETRQGEAFFVRAELGQRGDWQFSERAVLETRWTVITPTETLRQELEKRLGQLPE